jgi:hypothetical protein
MNDFINSPEWATIEAQFLEEIDKLKRDIPYKDKDVDYIAKRYVANMEAKRIITLVLQKTTRKFKELKKESVSYK